MVTADEQAAVDRLNEQLAQWRNVGQAEFAEMVGVSEAELLELIPQGVPYHAHPTSGYGEYRFHVSSIVSPTLYAVKPIRACCELCGAERHITEMAAGSGGYDWSNPDIDFQGSVGLLSFRCADGVGCRTNRRNAAELSQMEADAAEAARYDDNSPGVIGGGKQ